MKTFSEFLYDLCGKTGQGVLADTAGIDPGLFSKFKNGQGCLSLDAIEKILVAGKAVIMPLEELQRLESALETISDLWRQEKRKANGRGK